MTEVLSTTDSLFASLKSEENDLDQWISQEEAEIEKLKEQIQSLKLKLGIDPETSEEEDSAPEDLPPDPTLEEISGAPAVKAEVPQGTPAKAPNPFAKPAQAADDVVLYSKNYQLLLKGGVLPKVIQRLTSESYPEKELGDVFLMGYRKHATPEELLERLCFRYNDWSDLEVELEGPVTDEDKKLIRIKLANLFKRWITNHFQEDFGGNEKLGEELKRKCGEVFGADPLGQGILSAFEEQYQNYQKYKDGRPISSGPAKRPEVIPPKGAHWEDFDVVEVARQMSLLEYAIFRAILPRECLDAGWTKENRNEASPHVAKLVDFYNAVGNFVAQTVLKFKDTKERVEGVKKFIRLIIALFEINNFNGCQEIMSGLSHTSVYRLKKTWSKVEADKKLFSQYKVIQQKLSPAQNWKSYKSLLKETAPPLLPYLGAYLADLNIIEEGNKNYLTVRSGRTDVINLDKMRMQGKHQSTLHQ
eukprot:TRINITY_DN4685_c0_g1_i3.p1 TRINITY_DN4685_c0_g1~~TRINITY_DN4685_c0_g1_i3.p1  ORF type:complete len:474 (+),score=125.03 TRINITY_DN4685_c0_g1_i3:3-1424(+)